MRTPEEHFACFRAERRADALATVFDALAPELLLVAAHLARGGVQAEDLVQATFVDAIRGAERWDAARPLLPWLLGILTRNALAESRRAARQPDPRRVAAPSGESSPPDQAAARELADRVAAVVQGLPLVYRQVLSLRLAHGLSVAALAAEEGGVVTRAAIDVSAETAEAGLLPVVIEGRCVAEEDGAPLEGAAVTLSAGARGATPSQTRSAATRADGRFAVTLEPRAGDEVGLDLRAEGRVPRAASWSEPGAGTRFDLGDVRLARGQRLAGVVVDASGRPVPGVHLRLQGPAARPIAGSVPRSGRGRADAAARARAAPRLLGLR